MVKPEAELKPLRHSLARGTPFGDTHRARKRPQRSALTPRFDPEVGQSNRKNRMSPFAVPLLRPLDKNDKKNFGPTDQTMVIDF